MRAVLSSLRSLVFGETWTIPAGVALAVAAALGARAALPDAVWDSAGGFVLAALVAATLAAALARR